MSTSRELQPNWNDQRGIGATYNRGGRDNNRGGRGSRGGRGYHGGRNTSRNSQWNRSGRTQYGWGNQNHDDGYLDPATLSSMMPSQRHMYFIRRDSRIHSRTNMMNRKMNNEW